jgi:hypothetical protein
MFKNVTVLEHCAMAACWYDTEGLAFTRGIPASQSELTVLCSEGSDTRRQ